jgi:TrmH family RNA methyltransferase
MHESQPSADSIRQALSLVRSLSRRHVRDASGRFWVEGIRQFVQAFDAHYPFDTVVYSKVLLKSSLAEMMVRRLVARGVRRISVTPEQFRTVSTAERASGIGAILQQRWTPLGAAAGRVGPCVLAVDDLRSPGNLGTILRTAEATGVAAVVFLSARVDPYDPAVVRASMGGIFHLALIRSEHHRLRRWADSHGVRVVGLSPHAPRLWTDLPQDGRQTALLIGEERKGLSDAGRSTCHELVRLPMAGRADSLNVGVATGAMLYELVRRAGQAGLATGAGG